MLITLYKHTQAPRIPRHPSPHLHNLRVQVTIAAVKIFLQVLNRGGNEEKRAELNLSLESYTLPGLISPQALFHLITELKHQCQLLVTMQDIMKPTENERLNQIPKLASNIPIPAQSNEEVLPSPTDLT